MQWATKALRCTHLVEVVMTLRGNVGCPCHLTSRSTCTLSRHITAQLVRRTKEYPNACNMPRDTDVKIVDEGRSFKT